MKTLQKSICNSVARTGGKKRTEKVTSMEKFRKEMYSRLPRTMKKYGRRHLESRWCAKESPKKASDRYAVAVKKEKRTLIGHLPRKVSRVCSLFCDREVATI